MVFGLYSVRQCASVGDMKRFISPVLWIVAFQLIGWGIGMLTRQNMEWYHTLEKSVLNPPDIVFPIVWGSLYALLALAGWLIWQVREFAEGAQANNLFWMQMFLNWGWTFVFFEYHLILLGFVWIVALLVAMAAFMVSAWKIERRAAVLVVPTVLWGCFAAYLNYSIWILN